MEYIYHCKKNSRDYVYTTAIEFAAPQDAYAWRRGVREYADNYHASVTRKGWQGTDEAFAAEIDAHCVEARDKFALGDVPGERTAADPKTVEAKKMAVALRETGVTMEELAAALAAIKAAKVPPAVEAAVIVERSRKRA